MRVVGVKGMGVSGYFLMVFLSSTSLHAFEMEEIEQPKSSFRVLMGMPSTCFSRYAFSFCLSVKTTLVRGPCSDMANPPSLLQLPQPHGLGPVVGLDMGDHVRGVLLVRAFGLAAGEEAAKAIEYDYGALDFSAGPETMLVDELLLEFGGDGEDHDLCPSIITSSATL